MSGEKALREVLAVDVGGSHVKVLLSSGDERRRFDSGPELTGRRMVDGVLDVTLDWAYNTVSVGVPSPVHGGRVASEPVNLGTGWVGFDFEDAFGKPTKVVNDAAMQALGSYEGGRMLFLGLGTGLGSALVDGVVVESLELAHLPSARRPSRTTSASAAASASARRSGGPPSSRRSSGSPRPWARTTSSSEAATPGSSASCRRTSVWARTRTRFSAGSASGIRRCRRRSRTERAVSLACWGP